MGNHRSCSFTWSKLSSYQLHTEHFSYLELDLEKSQYLQETRSTSDTERGYLQVRPALCGSFITSGSSGLWTPASWSVSFGDADILMKNGKLQFLG